MTFLVSCPYCGQKLCKAAGGSKVRIQCPKCREELDLSVTDESLQVRPAKKDIDKEK